MLLTTLLLLACPQDTPNEEPPPLADGWTFEADRGGLSAESPDGRIEFSLGGRLHLDYVSANEDVTPLEDGFDVRRFRLTGEGKYDDKWTLRLDHDFGGLVEGWYGLWLRYEGEKPWYFTVGNIQMPFGLENAISSNDTTFLERSQLAALEPGYGVGVQAQYRGDGHGTTFGLFGNELDAAPARRSDGFGAVVRHTRALWREDEKLWHVGGSLELRDVDGGSRYRLRTRPELGTVENRLLDTGNLFDVDRTLTYGLESVVQLGPLAFQGEWIATELSRDVNDASFAGWYVQASYFLTGQTRRYRDDRGEFTDPADLQERSAWEVAARLSSLDLQDVDVTGGEGRNITLGVTWYVDRNVRVMANYVHADAEPNRNGVDELARAIALRLQVAF
jgi:phosphate-selective porin OprO/OprP